MPAQKRYSLFTWKGALPDHRIYEGTSYNSE